MTEIRKSVELRFDEKCMSLAYIWNQMVPDMKDCGLNDRLINEYKHYFFLGAESMMVTMVAAVRAGMDAVEHARMIEKECDMNIVRSDDD